MCASKVCSCSIVSSNARFNSIFLFFIQLNIISWVTVVVIRRFDWRFLSRENSTLHYPRSALIVWRFTFSLIDWLEEAFRSAFFIIISNEISRTFYIDCIILNWATIKFMANLNFILLIAWNSRLSQSLCKPNLHLAVGNCYWTLFHSRNCLCLVIMNCFIINRWL